MVKKLVISNNQMKHEITSLLFSEVKKSFFAAILVAGLLLIGLRHHIQLYSGIVWLTLLMTAYALRISIAHQYKKDEQKIQNVSQWFTRFRVSTAICGLAWGASSFFIFPKANIQLEAFYGLVIAGIAAGGLVSYYVDEKSSLLFTGSIVLLTGPAFIIEDNATARNILFLFILFVAYLAVACKKLAGAFINNMSLRITAVNQQKEIEALSLRQTLHLEHTPLGVIEWDEKLTISSWNKACTDMLGYTIQEAIGLHISFIMPEMINKPMQNILHQLAKYDKNQANLIKITHKNGNKIDCEWFNTILKNEFGEFIGITSLVQDKTEYIKIQDKIHQLAYYDVLTGLPNRGLVQDRLNQAITASERSQHFAMVAFIDLDHFKSINDIKGHDAGDFLLKTISNRLKQALRKQDTVARMGGDEFLLVLGDIGATHAEALAYGKEIIEKISHEINAPLEYDGYQHQCSASIGICLFTGSALIADEIVRRADMSMYLAKKQGRNCYQFYDDSMQPKYNYQLQLKSDLNYALAKNQFQLYLQGQFDRDAITIGAEALIRWQHPQYGLVLPSDFIPLAEETGAINPIGQWVMQEVCTLLKKWESSTDTQHLTISVNVSAIQFNHPEFMNMVQNSIKSSACNANKLCIELAESTIINSIEDLTHKMHQLRAMGVSLAIDDFGTGYSSLSVLKKLPLNALKIDKSFVQDMTNDSVESHIVQTILQMGKRLKLRIVAEGVETEQQLGYLRNFGCNIFQGYFFEKPCPKAVFEKSLNLNKQLTEERSTEQVRKKIA
jgi:diguanylate cyclase (GGDEF)-like protein/PAS domain S-box-containing protein